MAVCPQAAQESEAVDEGHSKVEDDGIGTALGGFAQSHFGR